jgi:uncharacterized membrane protein YgcG
MIIHNKTWLNNLKLHEQFEDDYDAGCLNKDELKILKSKYFVGFSSHSVLMRLGLFVLTLIIVIFSAGMLSLFLSEAHLIDNFVWPLILGIANYIILEKWVKDNYHYGTGVDNALIATTASFLIGGFGWMMDTINPSQSHFIAISLFSLIISIYLTLRFADLLMSALSCLSLLAFIFFAWQHLGGLVMATLPFVLMGASGAVYYFSKRMINHPQSYYYNHCLHIVEVVSLLTLYFSGNYYVVNELSNELHNTPRAPLPFGFVFWIITVLLPLGYIAWGVKTKNTIMLRIGLLLVAGAVYTFRTYYHLMPIEVALSIGGAVLLLVSYAVIKYLKAPKHGFTTAPLKRSSLLDHLNVESIIIGETFSHTGTAPNQSNSRFGGGSAGGGGSSANY